MADRRRNLGIPSGVVFPFAGTAAPYGYLLCQGQAVSRTEYAALFASIGTSHGSGDGSTTFNLPDYRGRFMRGVDGTAGNDPDKASRTAMAAGGNTANAVGSVQNEAFQDHNHQFNMGYSYDRAGSSQIISTSNTGNGSTTYDSNNGFSVMSTVAKTGFSPVRTATETRPKNVNVNYIIKV